MAIEIKLPKILNLPPKLRPIILRVNDFRYFLLDGGRSSAKTQAVARLLLYLGEQKKLHIVCGREIQNTLEESVYKVLADLVNNESLNYTVRASEIEHNETKTIFKFRGFRQQGAINIKGLEGVDILWVDESQSITKNTLDVIIPTIRKNRSKIFWTMNRHVEHDPVFVEFSTRADCLHIHVDYRDNDHCPDVMIKEAEICQAKNYADYEHIWLGYPLKKSSDFLFGIDLLRESVALDMDRYGVRRTIVSNDVARYGDNESVFTMLQSRGPVMWEQTHIEGKKGLGGDESVGKHASIHNDFATDAHVVDCDGIGGPIADMIKGKRYAVFEFYATKDYEQGEGEERESTYHDRRTAGYYKLLDWLEKGWLKILGDPVLIEQLLTIRYKHTPDGKKYIMSKEEMRKQRPPVPSPDRADALMMAVWFADDLMKPEFAQNNPSHAPMHTDLEQSNFRFDKQNPEYAE